MCASCLVSGVGVLLSNARAQRGGGAFCHVVEGVSGATQKGPAFDKHLTGMDAFGDPYRKLGVGEA